MKKYKIFIGGLILAIAGGSLGLASCSSDSDPGEGVDIPALEELNFSQGEANINDALCDFQYNLVNEAIKAPDKMEDINGNIYLSPFSASICMGMIANSVDIESETAILRMLNSDNTATLNETCNKLIRYLTTSKEGEITLVANSVWWQHTLNPSAAWKQLLASNYYARLEALDFSKNGNVDIINNWCSRNTKGMIPHLLSDISSDIPAYFINTLYYAGEWEDKFNKERTEKGVFLGRDKNSEVDFMHADEPQIYYKGKEFECVSLWFKDGTSMNLILPGENVPIEAVAGNLCKETCSGANVEKHYALVHLALPKFRIENRSEITSVLSSLGLPASITLEQLGDCLPKSLYIEQASSLLLDEEGVKAAAATVMAPGGLPSYPVREEVTLTFDRPFIYLLTNYQTGSILMAGVINNL